MSWGEAAALFLAMFMLALVPGVSTTLVVGRTVSGGFIHGAATTLGILCGDLLFITVALYGLGKLHALAAPVLAVLQVVGGLYLLWMGLHRWQASGAEGEAVASRDGSGLGASLAAGLLITLGDQKAVLFYLAFLPGYVDLEHLAWRDAAMVVGSAIAALGSTKLGYAWLAARGRESLLLQRPAPWISQMAAWVLLATGVWVIGLGLRWW